MIHKVLTTNFYHVLLKQLYLTLSLGNLSFVPSVTTPQNCSLLLVLQIILPTSVSLSHRSEFGVLFEQVAGTQTSSLPYSLFQERALPVVGIRGGGGPSPAAICLPAEALLTSPWSIFFLCEFTLQL